MRYGTAYLGLETDPAIFEMAVRALAEGNSIRATGRIVQIDKDTACDWLDRAAHQYQFIDQLSAIQHLFPPLEQVHQIN